MPAGRRKLRLHACRPGQLLALFTLVKRQIIVVGMGQLGALLAEGFSKSGHDVVPVLRGDDLRATCEAVEPEAVVVATGEDDLQAVLAQLPESVTDRVVLIQNELRPDQWLSHDLDPTVAVIWFEKKNGKPPTVVLPTVLFGKHAHLLGAALDHLALPHRTVTSEDELAHELVLKNLYILALNLAGLRGPKVASDLLESHRRIFDEVVGELIPLEAALLKTAPPFAAISLDDGHLRRALEGAILADPQHGCSGRSAPRRLQRTLEQAERVGLETPVLTAIREEIQ